MKRTRKMIEVTEREPTATSSIAGLLAVAPLPSTIDLSVEDFNVTPLATVSEAVRLTSEMLAESN